MRSLFLLPTPPHAQQPLPRRHPHAPSSPVAARRACKSSLPRASPHPLALRRHRITCSSALATDSLGSGPPSSRSGRSHWLPCLGSDPWWPWSDRGPQCWPERHPARTPTPSASPPTKDLEFGTIRPDPTR